MTCEFATLFIDVRTKGDSKRVSCALRSGVCNDTHFRIRGLPFVK